MKNASHILASLRQKPSFSKLAHFECIRRIQGLFPPHLQRLVRYGYFHNKILYFVLSHPGAKQEFDNIIASIKAPLKLYTPPECREHLPEDIRAFVTHRIEAAKSEDKGMIRDSETHYTERSEGAFGNEAHHPELHRLIERIREHIHARTDSEPA
ncbi:hypothetical protein LOH54_10500 [Sulfurimonas sp. HSL-3221]|uniref:hypothetical protein n=1 Tax=Thiomicrolovo sulfuroxydans TaxID=2894755 RepID=UPI001E4607F5|nr:hypothetical protein [Sulfurimonas sp. HSL-3221]UFS62076.1 hypothetical protein LOH54_10500 [Sulfurimonas sp. HSL-3221]